MKKWCVWALLLALALCASGLAEAVPTELSDYYGQDIAAAAEALGGLEYAAGEEFSDNYTGDSLALRGRGGLVRFIELRPEAAAYALCGVSNGMDRESVEALLAGYPVLWQYDEETAYAIAVNGATDTSNETLVVFYDEDGRVSGAWYRDAAM